MYSKISSLNIKGEGIFLSTGKCNYKIECHAIGASTFTVRVISYIFLIICRKMGLLTVRVLKFR